MRLAATVKRTLSATAVTAHTATLNILYYYGGAWWYERTAGTPADSACRSVAAGTTSDNLTGLTERTSYTYKAYESYTYKAYDKTGCNSADEILTLTFTTTADTMTASNVTHNSATLTLTGHVGNWWLKRTSPADANCKAKSTATTEGLSGLPTGAAYTYKAYSDASCSTEIAEESFTTLVSLTASRVTATGARLTIAGHTAQWWYKAAAGPHATCQGPVAANTAY